MVTVASNILNTDRPIAPFAPDTPPIPPIGETHRKCEYSKRSRTRTNLSCNPETSDSILFPGGTHCRYTSAPGSQTHESKQSPPRQSFGLSLERLEARDVPASYYWAPPLGSDLSAATASNWRIGSGPSLLASQPPDADDHLYFVGGLGQMDCLIPAALTASSGNAFAGMHLKFGPGPTTATGDGESGGGLPGLVGYWNTVTLADSFSVGALTVECGYISQGSSSVPSGNGSTLTVTSSLSWTGGTLNSNSVAGFINLAPGASGVAKPSFTNPSINGTVKLGSTVNLLGDTFGLGSTLDVLKGTFKILGGDGFEVREFCQLQVKPEPTITGAVTMDATTLSNVDKSIIKVAANGNVKFKPENRGQSTLLAIFDAKGSRASLLNAGGTVSVEDRTEVQLSGVFGLANEPAEGRWSFMQTAGHTKLEAGSKIVTGHGMYASAGNIDIRPLLDASTGQPAATQPDAFIGADPTALFTLQLRGTARLWMPGPGPYLKLHIQGDWYWVGGVVSFALVPSTENKSDKIHVTGTVYVVNAPTLELRWPTQNAAMTAVSQFTNWTLITCGPEKEITGLPAAPTLDEPNTQVQMEVLRGNNNKELFARKTN
jgi:hypothetical protein